MAAIHPYSPTFIVTRWFILILLLPAVGNGYEKPSTRERIDPAGIPGTLIISGSAEIPESTVDRFIAEAGGKKAKIVVFLGSDDEKGRPALARKFVDRWQSTGATISLVKMEAHDADTSKLLQTATGLWLHGGKGDETPGAFLDREWSSWGPSLRGKVVGLSGSAVSLCSRMDWLPNATMSVGAIEDSPEQPMGRPNAERVLYTIEPNATLIVRGRRIESIGDGRVSIKLPKVGGLDASERILDGRSKYADLTALRRALRDRLDGSFPPMKPKPPVVEKGTLIIVGGGGMPRGLTQRFVDLAGGKDASIVVLPTAMPDPLSERDGMAELLKKMGVGKVTVLRGRTPKEVESPEYQDALRSATGIWFGGGRQWRFIDAYEGTKAQELMFDVLRRGGVIAGSSAGASIQGEYMCRGDPLGNREIMAEGYERGLGFLPGVAIDQHFSQRGRLADMTRLMKRYPQLLGIGIDEGTAIVVQGKIAEVVGSGTVHFYDRTKPVEKNQPDYQEVERGGRYDLEVRKVLGP